MKAKTWPSQESTSLASDHRHVVADLIWCLSRLNPFTPVIHQHTHAPIPHTHKHRHPISTLTSLWVAMQVPAKQKYPQYVHSLPDQYAWRQARRGRGASALSACLQILARGAPADTLVALWPGPSLAARIRGTFVPSDALLGVRTSNLPTGDDMPHPRQRPRSHARSPLFVPILTTSYLHTHTYAQVRRP